MKVSLETKITTFTTLAAGGICAYLEPRHYVTGLVVGILAGSFFATDSLKKAQEMESFYHEETSITQKQLTAIASLSDDSLPGWKTASLNLAACSIPKTAAHNLFRMAGVSTGFVIAKYFALNRLALWTEQTQNRPVLNQLNALVL